MLQTLKNFWNARARKQITDPRNIGLYIFTVIVLAISWSTVKTIQTNYQLQEKVAVLEQQNKVLKLLTENIQLKNKYFETDQYLELAARQSLGLAAPGEKILLISKEVALKHIDQKLAAKTIAQAPPDDRSKIVRNLHDWRDFLLGRRLLND
ncbi:TPA: hypothetical protein DIS56_00375 [Candidatus Saccharibacteria bacterium]|nr:MAG: hypothetical protein UX30_C0002G0037 [Candidatus Saccharibacteria bacterium GW2011_GWA2_46_10]OGL35787.1 MAG: hypothetical protein A3F05_02000 [Candidatus Saccharibacteria bacterium RIFCSPHIGHO2_12_FULL_47_17]HCM51582.1 hypothetical protein [Candidatus Saccharibacteria bacterium]